jgi:hypothetical protein
MNLPASAVPNMLQKSDTDSAKNEILAGNQTCRRSSPSARGRHLQNSLRNRWSSACCTKLYGSATISQVSKVIRDKSWLSGRREFLTVLPQRNWLRPIFVSTRLASVYSLSALGLRTCIHIIIFGSQQPCTHACFPPFHNDQGA